MGYREQLFSNRYQQSKLEFKYFLMLHCVTLTVLLVYRIYKQLYSEDGDGKIHYFFKTYTMTSLAIYIVVSVLYIDKLKFTQYRIYFATTLFLSYFVTVRETLDQDYGDFKAVTHNSQIMTMFFVYFSLFSPLPWFFMISLFSFCWCYYFGTVLILYGVYSIRLAFLLQQILVILLFSRALYLKEINDIDFIKNLKKMDNLQKDYYGILQAIPECVMIYNHKEKGIGFTNAQMVKMFQRPNDPQQIRSDAFNDTHETNINSQQSYLEGKRSKEHNKYLCEFLDERISDYFLQPITEDLTDNQNSDNPSQNLNFNEDNRSNPYFLSMIMNQFKQGDDISSMYYKMINVNGVQNNKKDQNKIGSVKNKLQKKRVEVKCKKLNKHRYLVILKDVSIQREFEKNRTKNRLKTLFFASFAHELLTPLNILNGMNEEAISIVTDELSELKNLLYKNKVTIQKLNYLTEDIIDLSKYELNELKIKKTSFSFSDALNSIIELYNYQIQSKRLRLEVDIEPDLEDLVYTDEQKLKRILNNLLGNALKYTSNGYIKISVSISNLQYENSFNLVENERNIASEVKNKEDFFFNRVFNKKDPINRSDMDYKIPINDRNIQVCTTPPKNQVVKRKSSEYLYLKRILIVTVEDTGKGIPERKLPKLFKLFENQEFKGNINQGGIGIGLTACHMLSKALGGNIKAQNNFQSGSKFTFQIDITEPRQQKLNSKQQSKSSDGYISNLQVSQPLLNINNNNFQNDQMLEESKKQQISNYVSLVSEEVPKECYTDSPLKLDEEIRNHIILCNSNDKGNKKPQLISEQFIENDIEENQVLIVDDQEFNVEIAGRMVKRCTNLSFDGAYSALEGIEKIKIKQNQGTQYKYIFLDINMPGMDGIEMVKHLKKLEKEGQVDFTKTYMVALTALEESQLGDIYAVGFNFYIMKPLNWGVLSKIFLT